MRWTRSRSDHRGKATALAACTAAAAAVTLISVGGCTIVRNALGTHDSACFKALPAADKAVHSGGRFGGLHFTTIGDLLTAIQHTPAGAVTPPPDGLHLPPRTGVCVVEYRGKFQRGAVLDGWSPTGVQTGHFAIVLVRQSDLQVLATVVMEHPPLGFSRIFPRL